MTRWAHRVCLAAVVAGGLVYVPVGLAAPSTVLAGGGCSSPTCSAPPPPQPTGKCGTNSSSFQCNGADPASHPVDYPGTISAGSPAIPPGPAACTGYFYTESTTLIGTTGLNYTRFNPTLPMSGDLVWQQQTHHYPVLGAGGHVMVSTNNGEVSLADYLVVAEYYQGVRFVPAVPAVLGTPASAGPPPVPAVPGKAAVPARCVNNGPAQFKGLLATPVCPEAGRALCSPPSTSTPQVQDMYKYIVDTYLSGHLSGGEVTTVPSADALVGLPTSVWLKGANLPLSETFSDTQVSTNTWQGRALVLTLNVSLSLSEVVYNWGDGVNTVEYGPGATGTPGSNSPVQHTYYDVSVHGEHPTPYPVITPKDQIPVTAYGVEQLTATLSWIYPWGGVGSESLNPLTMFVPAVGAGVSSISRTPPTQATLQAHAAWIVVGQIESIPVCPTPTNCS